MAPQRATTADTSYHKKRLAQRMKDREFRDEYMRARTEIAQVDGIMQTLEELREVAGLSKADLARLIGKDPAAVRRLFTAQTKNPELKTVAALASALDAEILVVPKKRPGGRASRRRIATA